MSLHSREQEAILQTYKRLPIEIAYGKGVYLYDVHDVAYLDFLGGVAVNALGYGHDGLITAITEQAKKYTHVSNYFLQEPQVALAEKLKSLTGYSRVFFCNSGTEATEGALKLVRRWGHAHNQTTIVAMQNSFHGRTMGSLSLMSGSDYREGFAPFLDNCVSIPLNDLAVLRQNVNSSTAGVFLEYIQGEGGISEVTPAFIALLSELKKQFGFLIVADEVQSGIGRTGKFLACEHYTLRPDIVTLAKPLGGGLPLGAILVSEELQTVLQPGNHGTTFGGNPVACAAGSVVLSEIVDQGLMKDVEEVGAYFREHLNSLQAEFPQLIKEVRGKGLMVGVELSFPGKQIVDAMLDRKVLINCTHTNVLRFLPPLIVERTDIDQLLEGLRTTLSEVAEPTHASR